MGLDKLRLIRILLENRVKYPFIKNKLGEFEPNVFFGYSDHPLDQHGTPVANMFTAISKLTRKKASCVLSVELKGRRDNSFVFRAKAYNIFRLRDFERFYSHDYDVTEKTRFTECTLQLDLLREDVYRLRLAKGAAVPDNNTPMIEKEIRDHRLQVQFEELPEKYLVSTTKLGLAIHKENFHIGIYDSKGNLITESSGKTKNEFSNSMDAFPLGFIKDRKCKSPFGVESFVIYPGEGIYGLGEQFGPLNKIGQTIGLWHSEGVGNTAGRIYKSIPFFMSTRGYGVFINESKPVTFWVGSKEYCKNQIAIEGGLIDYYFFAGSFKDILNNYTDLTGKASVPPRFSFGVWMSRITYSSQQEVLKVARKLRDMRFPCDVIHIDTGWFDEEWRCDWQFGKKNFPAPQEMFRELREMGFRVSLWQTPYVLDETAAFKEATEKKILAKNRAPFVFVGKYPAHPIDFSNPEAVTWYQGKLKELFAAGAAVIKADFGEGIEPAMEFKEYPGRGMHNLYPLLYNKAAFEVSEETFGQGVIWARSAYAGSQRYPVHWSGDNSSNFENLLCSLRGGLSLGMCGFTYWSQDTGGFVGIPSDELYIRWTQLSIFQSHMRYHGCPPRYREPWNYEPATQEIVRRFLNLRYQLIPYLYTEAQIASQKGLPLLSPLVIEFQNDPNVRRIEDQFMCGRNLLIAPILTADKMRSVYIPEGTWFDFWTDEQLRGPRWVTLTCDLEDIPVFARAGSVLPLGPEVQCTDELKDYRFLLKVYPDSTGLGFYEILDKDKTVQIRACLEAGTMKVTVDPEPLHIEVAIPASMHVSELLINDKPK